MPTLRKMPAANPQSRAKQQPERHPRQRLVLFRYSPAAKLMQKIHTLTDN
jgi:hypothetical protein